MINQLTFLINEAKTSLRNRNLKSAELFLRQASILDAKNFEILRLSGVLEAQKKNYEKALDFFKKALKVSPSSELVISNIGNIYFEQRKFHKALEFFESAINLNQNYADAYGNRGNTLQELRNFNEAIISYDKAIAIDPNDAKLYINQGNAFMETGRLESAIACYEHAIQLQPDDYSAYWHASLALLLSGNFNDGFRLYEARWADSDQFRFTGGKRNFPQELWLGSQSLIGKTILIYCEQGLGDALQFCRYVRLVSDLGANVILEAPEPLIDLFSRLEGVSELIIKGQDLPLFDYHCPLLSLPLALNTTIDSIPFGHSYLSSDPAKVRIWNEKLGKRKKIRIGIAWSSVSEFKNDFKRSLLLSDFVKALPDGDYEYICLQKELKECDKNFFYSYKKIMFFGDDLKDFGDTAALIDCVDLVITTCTSVPHLSAALGKETWILLSFIPDWRWLLDRLDSPWYPSVKLFRQEGLDDWGKVLGKVKENITDFCRQNIKI